MPRLAFRNVIQPGMWAHYARLQRAGAVPHLHTHDFHEVFWVEGGRGVMLTPEGPVPLAPGDLLLVHADDCHGFVDDPGACLQWTNFAFAIKVWDELVARFRPDDDPMSWSVERRKRRLGPDELGSLRLACADLDHGRRDRLAAESLFLAIFGLLREEHNRVAVPDWLTAGCRALEQGRWRGGTSALIAASGRSREHVARVCRAVFGKSPTELVTDLRLGHLAKRLVESDEPIADLCAETGLTNLAHVYRLFRRAYGVSPAAWRKHQRLVVGN